MAEIRDPAKQKLDNALVVIKKNSQEEDVLQNPLKIDLKSKSEKNDVLKPLKLDLTGKKSEEDRNNTLEKIKITTVNRPVNADKSLTTYVIKKQNLDISTQAIVPVNRGDSKSFNVKLVKIDSTQKYALTSPVVDSEETQKNGVEKSPLKEVLPVVNVPTTPSNTVEKDSDSGIQLDLPEVNNDHLNSHNDDKVKSTPPCQNETAFSFKKLKKSKEHSDSKSVTSRDPSPSEENSIDNFDNSNLSESSPNSTESPSKRNMRSQNVEFSLKQQKFLNRINNENEISDNSDDENTDKMSEVSIKSVEIKNRVIHPPPKPGWDAFCWRCHFDGAQGLMITCTKCIRSFHTKCLKTFKLPDNIENFECPECVEAETSENSALMKNGKKKLAIEHLSYLLGFALKRMFNVKGSNEFASSVDKVIHVDYDKFVVNPMTLNGLQSNINNRKYKCIEAFMHDCKYLLHNCVIYPVISKYKPIAKALVKVARQEAHEIETCFECYQKANQSADWFVEVCTKPHILLWAKLKGFPHWPAKGMAVNSAGLVDVRFFGDHDRAWVPVKDCYLYSEKDPNTSGKTKRNNMSECLKEVDIHIEKLKDKYGEFRYAPFMANFDPNNELSQLQSMLPNYKEPESTVSAPEIPEFSPKTKLTLKIIKKGDNNLSIASDNGSDVPEKVEKYEICHKTFSNSTNEETKTGNTAESTTPNTGKLETMVFKRKSDNGSWKKVAPAVKKAKQTSDEVNLLKRKKSEICINDSLVKKGKLDENHPAQALPTISAETEKPLDVEDSIPKMKKPYERRTRSKSVMKIKDSAEIEKPENPVPNQLNCDKKNDNESCSVESNDTVHLRRKSLMRHAKTKSTQNLVMPTKSTNKTETETAGKTKPLSEQPPTINSNSTEQNSSKTVKNPNTGTHNAVEAPSNIKFKRKTSPDLILTDARKLYKSPVVNLKPIVISKADCDLKSQKIFQQMSTGMVYIPSNSSNQTTATSAKEIVPTLQPQSSQLSNETAKNKKLADPTNTLSENHKSSSTADIQENGVKLKNEYESDKDEPTNMLTETAGISPEMAKAVADAISTCPPKLEQRPAGALKSTGDFVYPSQAGRVSKVLMDSSYRMADFFRSVIEDTLSDLAGTSSNVLEAKVRLLEAEIEKVKFQHQQEISKLKNNTDSIIIELRNSMEIEKSLLINEVRKQCEQERIRAVERAIEDTKKKQWCSNCGKEAEFYCCWNTSYCDIPCQQTHWPKHMVKCSQTQRLLNNTANKPKASVPSSTTSKDDETSKVINKSIPPKALTTIFNAKVHPTIRRISAGRIPRKHKFS